MRRFVAIAVIILLFLIAVVWAVGRSGSKPNQAAEVASKTTLSDYAGTTTEARFTKVDHIEAREDHRVLQITVGRDFRTIQILSGYQGEVIKEERLPNDPDAYRAFLASLDTLQFDKAKTAKTDEGSIGRCPAGFTYYYDLIDGADTKQSLWSTTCKSAPGTFAGKKGQIEQLFQRQIPQYFDFVRDSGLSS